MTEETIRYLEDLKDGRKVTLTKQTPDEAAEIITTLKNFGILYDSSKYDVAAEFKSRKYLTKLIELNSLTDFLNWLDTQNADSTVGQVTQLSSLSNTPQASDIVTNSKSIASKRLLNKLWELISENKLVSSIILIIILYLIKTIFGIDLKI